MPFETRTEDSTFKSHTRYPVNMYNVLI